MEGETPDDRKFEKTNMPSDCTTALYRLPPETYGNIGKRSEHLIFPYLSLFELQSQYYQRAITEHASNIIQLPKVDETNYD